MKKLTLSKETLRGLNEQEQIEVLGGQRPNTKLTQCAQDGCTKTAGTYLGVC